VFPKLLHLKALFNEPYHRSSIMSLSMSKYFHLQSNFVYRSRIHSIIKLTLPIVLIITYFNICTYNYNIDKKNEKITWRALNCNFSSSMLTLATRMLLDIPRGFEYWPLHDANRLNKFLLRSRDNRVLQASTVRMRILFS
jgi:hypothetical protein